MSPFRERSIKVLIACGRTENQSYRCLISRLRQHQSRWGGTVYLALVSKGLFRVLDTRSKSPAIVSK